MWILITVKIVSWRSSTDSCLSLNADRPLFRALNAVTIVSKQFRTLIYFYILNYVMFTGKIKFNYLVIKVVLSTVIKGQKRVDLFKDHKIDLEIIMTINLFLVSIDQILIIIIGNVLVFANKVTYLYWRAQYSINPVFINRTP